MILTFLSHIDINTVFIALGGLFLYLNQRRSQLISDSNGLIATRDKIISDLRNEIAVNKAKFESDIHTLQAKYESDIRALQTQVDHLKEANVALQNTVTGKETLEAIQSSLLKFQPLIQPGGLLAKFEKNDQEILRDIGELKEMLKK